MIVVAGEALVDLVPAKSTLDGEPGALLPRLGGGPYNVAVTVGRLGTPVSFLSRISTDDFGDALVERLTVSNVDASYLQRGPEPTTLAVTSLGPDGSARYTFYAEGTADRLFEAPSALPEAAILSLGTLSLVLEPGASAYEQVMRRTGALIALDPNVRPVLIADADAYRARFESWLPDVGLLKLSEEDAEWLAGKAPGPKDAVEAAREWQQRGPAAVVLTRGSKGLAVVTGPGELIEVPATETNVVDTIGAGDTVQGALLSWLYTKGVRSSEHLRALDGQAWRTALRFAGAAAAITVSRAGAEPPFAAELGPII
ncbi:carbohydrate kinase family protein [Kibdelosporangium phytohabitans]|uniref:Sugar kinase n=1 Tax=Kibdelosporangium phytohabitans TaxID=860235 RepID=A0A0N9HV66_9PSEU|nr:carbohydrate kinase [Kibdelosporangium phytohabitans]ALG06089.1 sugar kinase [Kibdelosporangium phytohabitans]MBE1465825.1 fructokinase [Kibdelosporangium phytohabitans]